VVATDPRPAVEPRRPTPAHAYRPAHSLLHRWGVAVARRHRLVLAGWLLILVGAGLSYPVLQDRLGAPDYTVRGSESARAQELRAAHFPRLGDEQGVIVFRSARLTVEDPAYAGIVDRVLAGVRGRQGVTGAVGPLDPASEAQVSSDRRAAVALVGLDGDAAARARLADDLQSRVRRQASGSPVEAYLTGSSPLNNDLSRVELADQEFAERIGLPIALVVLVLALGGLVAAVLPVGLALASVLVCMGILTPLAGPLHLDRFVTVVTTMIGIGVGIDYALFVVSRFREELARRRHEPGREATAEAVGIALHTSGRTILASGLIVMVALGAMVLIDGHIFVEIAVAAALVVACAVTAGLTLLPALLALLGPRVNAGRLPGWRRRRGAEQVAAGSTAWARWARFTLRYPIRLGLPVLLLLGIAALPIASIRLGLDLGLASLSDTPSGRGQQILAGSFSKGSVNPVEVVGCTRSDRLDTEDLDGVARLAAAARADRRVAQVVAPTDLLDSRAGGHTSGHLAQAVREPALRPALSRMVDTDRGGRCALVDIVLAVPVDSTDAGRFVHDLRTRLAPQSFPGTEFDVRAGGLTAQYADLSAETTRKLPLVVAVVLALSFCYLLLVFRSLLLPAKAVILNLVATGAALGLTVLVFQFGYGARMLDFHSVGTLQAYLPVALFALLFGLSMDYEVFLVRRMHEEWLRTGDNAEAVATAIAHTARQITAAAAIMVAVFGSFLVADVLELKQFGFGLAVAVLIDATVIRLLLVPAIMSVASRGNWWLPAALDRRLPKLHLE
jgi:RND superfamily putative drug exporter